MRTKIPATPLRGFSSEFQVTYRDTAVFLRMFDNTDAVILILERSYIILIGGSTEEAVVKKRWLLVNGVSQIASH